jgi:hypothetical protein
MTHSATVAVLTISSSTTGDFVKFAAVAFLCYSRKGDRTRMVDAGVERKV